MGEMSGGGVGYTGSGGDGGGAGRGLPFAGSRPEQVKKQARVHAMRI